VNGKPFAGLPQAGACSVRHLWYNTAMSKFRLAVYSLLFLVPVCLLPAVTHRLIVAERSFGRETGQAYLRATAEAWADRLGRGEPLPAGAVGPAPAVAVAEVDAAGRLRSSGRPFPADSRCFGEARAGDRRVRATWPGDVGRGQAHARRLSVLEQAVTVVFFALVFAGFLALLRELLRARAATRRQVDYVADISHRLKTPLTSISLCAELAQAGRLDERRREESTQTIVAEASKLGAILDDVLAHVKEMRRG